MMVKNISDEVSNHIKVIGKCYKRTALYFTLIDECFFVIFSFIIN
jgi:hypothetical protein